MTDQDKPEPAIDHREVARLAREAFAFDPTLSGPTILSWAEDHLRAEQTYLAGKGIPSAEDPRDAEIRKLESDNEVLRANQSGLLLDKQRLIEQVHEWHRRALAAESKPVEKPAEAKEPTRTERLVRFARDARALDIGVCVTDYVAPKLELVAIWMTDTEAAAVRAALEEKPDAP